MSNRQGVMWQYSEGNVAVGTPASVARQLVRFRELRACLCKYVSFVRWPERDLGFFAEMSARCSVARARCDGKDMFAFRVVGEDWCCGVALSEGSFGIWRPAAGVRKVAVMRNRQSSGGREFLADQGRPISAYVMISTSTSSPGLAPLLPSLTQATPASPPHRIVWQQSRRLHNSGLMYNYVAAKRCGPRTVAG
jgi:hypothetical protein